MKHLFSGIALAALLAAGAPALAQSNSAKQPAASPSAGASTSTTTQQSGTTTPPGATERSSKSAGTGMKHQSSPSDNMAEQLNREELERVQHGGQTSGSGQSQSPAATPSGSAGGTSGAH
jgi:hypothetical protein